MKLKTSAGHILLLEDLPDYYFLLVLLVFHEMFGRYFTDLLNRKNVVRTVGFGVFLTSIYIYIYLNKYIIQPQFIENQPW
jgi:hypothetical protein